MVTRNLSLNINPLHGDRILNVSQWDVGAEIHCKIYDGFKQIQISGASATVIGTRSDQVGFSESAEISSNEVVFELSEAMTGAAGNTEAQVVLVKDDEKVLTNKITIVVEKEAYNG